MVRRIALAISLMVLFTACSVLWAQDAKPDTSFTVGHKDGGKQETTFGDLATDAMRASLKTDIAFIQGSELRNLDPPLPIANIEPKQLYAAISFPEDPLAVLSLTGKQVQAALERSVSLYPQRNLGFLQVSGIKFTFNPQKPSGKRVSAVVVGKNELSDTATYTVAVTDSMSKGALGYWNIWSASSITKRYPDQSLKKALDAYLKSNPKLQYKVPSRTTLPEPPSAP